MSRAVEKYLDRVMVYANRSDEDVASLRNELKDHLTEKAERLMADGVSAEDAVFQAIEDHGSPRVVGYGLRGKFPLVDIRTQGTARGVIAIGPKAVGIFAFGGAAFGVFACGGAAVGLITMGGICAALLFGWGGMAVASWAYAGVGVGVVAMGGMVFGIVAMGGKAFGLWVPAGGSLSNSYFTSADVPEVLRLFDSFLKDPSLWMGATLVMLPILLLSIFIPQYLMHRENRRIRTIEPWAVVES